MPNGYLRRCIQLRKGLVHLGHLLRDRTRELKHLRLQADSDLRRICWLTNRVIERHIQDDILAEMSPEGISFAAMLIDKEMLLWRTTTTINQLDKHVEELRSMVKWWMNHHKESEARPLELELGEAQTQAYYWRSRTDKLLDECAKEREARRGLQSLLTGMTADVVRERELKIAAERQLEDAMPQISASDVCQLALTVGAPMAAANRLAEAYQEAMDKASGAYDSGSENSADRER